MGQPASFLDGERAGRRAAELSDAGGDLLIACDGDLTRWPLTEVRALRDQSDGDRLILRLPDSDARVIVEDRGAIAWVLRTCPALDAHVRDPMGTRRIGLWSAGALAVVVLMLTVILPGLAGSLAPLVPRQAEVRMGEAVLDQSVALFSRGQAPFCTARGGVSSLRVMEQRLTDEADVGYDLKVAVVRSDMVNAFALPGGHIVLMSALIDEAESAEEVAAVLAHEIGHVAHRDPTRLALQSAGTAAVLGLVVGDFFGVAAVAAASSALLDAHYSREAERAADDYATARLLRAGVSPAALATFFERLAAKHGDAPEALRYFSTHPRLGDRAALARDRAEHAADRPILTPDEWQSLRTICDHRSATP